MMSADARLLVDEDEVFYLDVNHVAGEMSSDCHNAAWYK
jgi:hypothetical protein